MAKKPLLPKIARPWVYALGAIAVLGFFKGRKQIYGVFSKAQLFASTKAKQLGLSNVPPPEAQRNLDALVENTLNPLQKALGPNRKVRITSGYRSKAVNEAAGGAAHSQHMSGEAADIKVDGMDARRLALFVRQAGIPYDQLIWYDPERGGHVHISYRSPTKNRKQALRAPKEGGYKRA